MSIRVYIRPDNLDEIHTYMPNLFRSPGNGLDADDTGIVIGYCTCRRSDYDPPVFQQIYNTYGYDQNGHKDWLERDDEDNSRIACFLTNFESDENGIYLDVTDSGTTMANNRWGISILTTSSNLKQKLYEPTNNYRLFAANSDNFASLEAAYWDARPTVVPSNGSASMINTINQGWLQSSEVYAMGLFLDAKIPIFIDELSAKKYVDTGVIDDNTCFNPPGAITDVGDNDYFIRSWTYRYNAYKDYESHDTDKHRLDIKAGGNKVVGYINEGEYYNIRLVAEGEHTMVWYTSDGGEYSGSTSEFNNSQQARAYNTFNQYKTYRDGFVKGGWWDTNIYIYADEADARMALENPESVLPINPYDVDETPSPHDTGTNVDTEADLTSQTHDASTGLITLYESSAAALNVLGSALYTANTSFLDGLKIYGESPINSLISVYHCPIDLDSFITKEPASAFKVGSNTVTTTGANIVKTYGKIVALGSVLVNPIYNDFRDYTNLEYELHLPFSNPIMLDASEIMGKTLTIKATVDPYNLQIRYYIIVNSVVYKFIDASFGKQVAVLGNDGAGKARELRQDIMGITGNAIGIATGMASGNPVLTANNVMQAVGGIYATLETEKREPKKQVVGAFANGCGENDILYPYLSITETLSIAPTNLASVYGRPTNLITRLGNLHGFIAAEMPMLEVDCSDAEREELIAAISEGIIL